MKSFLITIKNSLTSVETVKYFANLPICPDDVNITLIHVFRKPSASEELMGETFTDEEYSRFMIILQQARDELVQHGFNPDKIETRLITEPYPTITDGIIDQFNKKKFDLVVLGRRAKSKAEEFVLGDVSVKLVRALKGTGVLVVT
ncbi:Universal stress protein, UspA-like [Candidatus Magnetomoraceae bacterium gMMP-15]